MQAEGLIMATVYLPLGSVSASGTFGGIITYKGQQVQVYTVPTDPRTGAQLNVRKLFYDITKTVKTAGPWTKGALATVLGPRWYTLLYKETLAAAAAADVEWAALPGYIQALWADNAPFVATWNDPGRVFFGVYWALTVLELDAWNWLEENEDDPVTVRALWDTDLSGVTFGGQFDNGGPGMTFTSGWSTITDVLAVGGSYKKVTSGGDESCSIYFFGSELILTFLKGAVFTSLDIRLDGVAVATVLSQNNGSTLYGQAWSTGVLHYGLHVFRINCHNLGGSPGVYGPINLDSIEIVGKKAKRTKAETVGKGEMVFPAGFVFGYAGPSYPAGWLPCDGSSRLRSDYPTLFAAIGTLYGAADVDHFNLPDLRGRVLVGAGTGLGDGGSGTGVITGTALTARARGDWFGGETHLLTTAQLAAHAHTQAAHSHTDAGHTHTQAAHSHTDAGHTHTQAAHSHTVAGRDSSAVGAQNSFTSSSTAGTATTLPTSSATPAINSGAAALGNATPAINSGAAALGNATPAINSGAAALGNATPTIANAGGGTAHPNMQPGLVMTWLIKT
jgi:microcystin-dependent protein